MRYTKILALTLFSPMIWADSLPSDVSVTVFTTQNYSIQDSTLAHHIYYLDAVENIEEGQGDVFSTVPEKAAEQAKKWLHSSQGKKFQSDLQQAYIGIIEGWKLEVMKVPAIVFQHSRREPMVVYGSTDINKAILIYKNASE